MPSTVQLPPSREAVGAVANNLSTLLRTFAKARTQFIAAAAEDVESSAHVLLKCLANEGPLRAGALAELINSDPSTVSRQVAALVKDGYIQRQADPVDGRATLLVLTTKADELVRRHDALRDQQYADMLASWDDAELRQFAAFLSRFTHDFNQTKNDWLPARSPLRAVPAGGND